jgi:hypothetical protein
MSPNAPMVAQTACAVAGNTVEACTFAIVTSRSKAFF